MLVFLGFRADGRPIHFYSGGSEGAPEGDGGGDDDGDEDEDEEDGEKGLTDGGRKAIERERAAAKRARDEARPWKALAKELGLSPEQVRERLTAKPDKDQVDVDKVRREAAAEATQRANTRILKSEIKALAADLLADPADAALYLDLSDYEVDDDGKVPEREIKRDLKALLASKPHLAKVSKRADYEGGRGGAPSTAGDMNETIRNLAGRRGTRT